MARRVTQMRSLGTTLSTSVQADRHGPSITTRSPDARTSSNISRNGPTCPPGLARMRTSACAGGTMRPHSIAARKIAFAFTMVSSLRRGTHQCPAPLMVSDRSSSRPVLDGAHDRRQHGASNAATGNLTDDAADIRRRCGIGKQWNQHAEDLSAGAAADGARDGISKRAEIDILGGAGRNVSTDGAANDLDDQIDEHSRHNVTLPRSGVQFHAMHDAGPSPRVTT